MTITVKDKSSQSREERNGKKEARNYLCIFRLIKKWILLAIILLKKPLDVLKLTAINSEGLVGVCTSLTFTCVFLFLWWLKALFSYFVHINYLIFVWKDSNCALKCSHIQVFKRRTSIIKNVLGKIILVPHRLVRLKQSLSPHRFVNVLD